MRAGRLRHTSHTADDGLKNGAGFRTCGEPRPWVPPWGRSHRSFHGARVGPGRLSFLDGLLARDRDEDVRAPCLGGAGSEQEAPFLHGNVAKLVSDLAREMTKQSMAAWWEGRNTVAPSIALPASSALLAEIATYMELRGAKYAEAIGGRAPSPPLEILRLRTIGTFREQSRRLAGDAPWDPAPSRSSAPACARAANSALRESSGFLNRVSQVRFLPGARVRGPLTRLP